MEAKYLIIRPKFHLLPVEPIISLMIKQKWENWSQITWWNQVFSINMISNHQKRRPASILKTNPDFQLFTLKGGHPKMITIWSPQNPHIKAAWIRAGFLYSYIYIYINPKMITRQHWFAQALYIYIYVYKAILYNDVTTSADTKLMLSEIIVIMQSGPHRELTWPGSSPHH